AGHVERPAQLADLREDLQGLVEDHLRRLTPEVLVERTAVDDDRPASFLDPHPGRGLLAAAGGVVPVLGLDRHVPQASTWRGAGFCAAWGGWSAGEALGFVIMFRPGGVGGSIARAAVWSRA